MDKDFFVQEIEGHRVMRCRSACSCRRRVEAKRHVTGVTLLAEEKMGRERHSPGSLYRKSAEGSMYDV